MTRHLARRTVENALGRLGFAHVAGVDEVGRGCLAGPVVAAAVVLDPARHIAGLRDSKLVPAAGRERLYDTITRRAMAWAVAAVEPAEIDRINIHQRVAAAMRQAVMTLSRCPTSSSSTHFASPTYLCRSGASSRAIVVVPRSRPRPSSRRCIAIG